MALWKLETISKARTLLIIYPLRLTILNRRNVIGGFTKSAILLNAFFKN